MTDSAAAALVALVDALDDPVLDRLATRLAPWLRTGEHSARPAAYTVATLAQELGVSRRAIRGAIERGELAAIKRGGRWIITAQAVTAWAEPQHEGATATSALPRPRVRTATGATLADVVRSLDAGDEDR